MKPNFSTTESIGLSNHLDIEDHSHSLKTLPIPNQSPPLYVYPCTAQDNPTWATISRKYQENVERITILA